MLIIVNAHWPIFCKSRIFRNAAGHSRAGSFLEWLAGPIRCCQLLRRTIRK